MAYSQLVDAKDEHKSTFWLSPTVRHRLPGASAEGLGRDQLLVSGAGWGPQPFVRSPPNGNKILVTRPRELSYEQSQRPDMLVSHPLTKELDASQQSPETE
jgi:hypothetical protein